jgi:prophage regulatory protein
MNQQQPVRIIRIAEARNLCGLCKSSFYDRVKNGLFPPAINLGGRAVGWVESEIKFVINAMIAGKSEGEIKTLIIELTQKRQELK